jgi:predicted transcriptional regulator
MARNWSEVRAKAAPKLDERRIANARKLLEESVRAHRLADIRKAQGESQDALAKTMKVTQARVSKIEHGDIGHTELSTLASYVEALGGRLEVTARFGDQTITVK